MMKPTLSPHDWELLSAYLDGALHGPDLARLQTRLEQDVTLRAGLQGLQSTQALLRAAAQRRRPRSFTIPAALGAQLRPARNSFGLWRLVSAAASLVLVTVLASQALGTPQLPLAATLADEAPQAFMLEMAVEESAPAAGNAVGDAGEDAVEEFALDLAAEDEALRSTPASKEYIGYTPTLQEILLGLAVVIAVSSLLAWQQWRKLPDR